MVTKPSLLSTASQAQHNTEVANPWILTQKKKKNQYRANQKSIHGHVIGRENQIQSIQSKSKPNPITQYYNTDLFIKKKNPIQSKPNPKPRKNQTHGETVTSLAGAARSVARRHRSFAPRHRSSQGPRCKSSQIADRCSATPVLGLKVFLSLFLSDSHSLSFSLYLKSEMNDSVSVSLYSLRVTLSL